MRFRVRLIAGAFIGLIFGTISWLGLGDSFEELAADAWLRHQPAREATNKVQLVVIDDHDIELLGQWPIPRGAHVNAVQILEALGTKNICFDILFSEASRDPKHDAALQEIVNQTGIVTMAYYFQDIHETPAAKPGKHFLEGNRYGVDPEATDFRYGHQPRPLFADFDAAFGAVNAKQTSTDKLIRRIPLFLAHDGKLYPTIGMQAVIKAMDLEPDQIRIAPGKDVSLIGTPNGTIRIPIDKHCQMRVNFDSTESLFRRSISYLDMFEIARDAELAEQAKDDFNESITFLGNVSTGNTDVILTRAGPLPGVVVQAAVAENILSGNFIRSLPAPIVALLILAICLLVSVLTRGAHPLQSLFGTLLVCALWTVLTMFAIKSGLILPYVSVVAAAAVTLLILYFAQIRRVIEKFGGYVPKALRATLFTDDAQSGRPQRRELTIFFSDIRGFTNWTEQTDPDEVSEVLNDYLGAMADVVAQHQGTLDKFIGDCVMAFFGAPVVRKDHAEAALRMAWEMQLVTHKLNEKWAKQGRKAIEVGMGLNTDFVTFGDFGSHQFRDYTVIGRGVNLAARIESISPGGKVLVSERTRALVQDIAKTRAFVEIQLKGISGMRKVYEVLEIKGEPKLDNGDEGPLWRLVDEPESDEPYPKAGLEAMLSSGRLSEETPVQQVGSDDTIRLGDVIGSK